MKPKKAPEAAANVDEAPEKVQDAPPNLWVNLDRIKMIVKDAGERYKVYFTGEPGFVTFYTLPLSMKHCYGRDGWVAQ